MQRRSLSRSKIVFWLLVLVAVLLPALRADADPAHQCSA